jgi:O-phosphoseryl-tRNA(Cys) synthetase
MLNSTMHKSFGIKAQMIELGFGVTRMHIVLSNVTRIATKVYGVFLNTDA